MQFLGQFAGLKLNTRARYAFVLSAFFRWYSGEKLPMKIRQAKILPQYVPGEDIDRLIERIKGKKSHKKSIERDIGRRQLLLPVDDNYFCRFPSFRLWSFLLSGLRCWAAAVR